VPRDLRARLFYADTRSEVDPQFYRRSACLGKRFGRDNGTDTDIDREDRSNSMLGAAGVLGS
jgi:hypothetical protein